MPPMAAMGESDDWSDPVDDDRVELTCRAPQRPHAVEFEPPKDSDGAG